jgi:hypothetical protein
MTVVSNKEFSTNHQLKNDTRRVNKTIGMDGQIKRYESVSGVERFLLALKEGRALGGLRNVEASEIIRRSKETDFRASERRLTQYAKDNDCWFDVKEIKENFKGLYMLMSCGQSHTPADNYDIMRVTSFY